MYVINNDINCVTPFVWNFKHSRVFKPGALPSPGQKHHRHLLSSTCFAAAAGRSKFCGERNLEILEIFEEKWLFTSPLWPSHFNLFLAMFRSGSPLYGHNLAIFFSQFGSFRFCREELLSSCSGQDCGWLLDLTMWKKNNYSFGGEH